MSRGYAPSSLQSSLRYATAVSMHTRVHTYMDRLWMDGWTHAVPVESARHLRGDDSTVAAEALRRCGCRIRVLVVAAVEAVADGLG